MQVDLDNNFSNFNELPHTLSPPISIVYPLKKRVTTFRFFQTPIPSVVSSVDSSKKTTQTSSTCSTPLQFALELEPPEPVDKPIEVKNLLIIPKNLTIPAISTR